VGANTVDVLVTAQDGVTTQTYTVTVTRTSALTELSQYDGTGAAPTVATYGAAGVTGVTPATLSALNSALAVLTAPQSDEVAEIQAMVSGYGVVLAAAAGQGTPTLAQLAALGLDRLSEARLPAMRTAIAATPDDGSGVDTLPELQAVLDATMAVGVTMAGPVVAGRQDGVTLTLQVVDAQGRASAVESTVRVRVTSSRTGSFVPSSLVTLVPGSASAVVQYQSAEAGAHTLTATWLEGATDGAAPGRTGGTHLLTVQRGLQTVTLQSVATQALSNGTVPLTAASSAGLSVTLASQTPTVCAVAGGMATLVAAGTCTVAASQAGDADWQAAASVSESFAVVQPSATLARVSSDVGAAGGTAEVGIAVTPASTRWAAVSSADWLATTSTGVGSGAVQFVAAANPTSQPRTATITVGGQQHRVTQAPSVQLTLRVGEVRGSEVRLEWLYAGPPTAGFVLEGGAAPGQILATVVAGAQTFMTVSVGAGRYFVRVRTLEDSARQHLSNEVPLLVGQPDVPSTPAQLTAVVLGARVVLQWMPTYEGGEPRDMDVLVGGAFDGRALVGRVDHLVVDSVQPGTYTVEVASTNDAGMSGPSNRLIVTVPAACTPPQAPSWVTYGVAGRTVTLRWQSPESGAAPTDYRVTAEGVGSASTGMARVISGTLPPGTYRVWVQAVNPCGTSAPSLVQTIVVP
jgi:hypothetical protein